MIGTHPSALPDDHAEIGALYRQVAARAPLPIAMTAGPGHLLCGANPVCCQLLGTAPEVLLGQPFAAAVPPTDTRRVLSLLDQAYSTDKVALESDPLPAEQRDQVYWVYIAWPIHDVQGRPAGLVVQIHDATSGYRDRQALSDTRALNAQLVAAAQRERELLEQLQQQLALVQALALTDELTGLYNRRGFMTLAAQQLKLARRTHHTLSLIFLDLDGLKHINDSWGHAVGNQAIIMAAQILTDTFRDSDIIARFGGDEYVVLAMDSDAEDPGRVLERLQAQTARHMAHSTSLFQLSLSMGIAHTTAARPCTLEELPEQADARMYLAKESARSQRARSLGGPPHGAR